jgi:DNA-directed RNA polymerase specialized sigma24 family protein
MANETSDGDTPVEGLAPETRACPYIRDGDLPPELIRRVRACAGAITGDRHAVDDIQQQVYKKLLSVPRDRWDTIKHKWGYVIRIAQNESRTWLKRARRGTPKPGGFMNSELFELNAGPTASGAAWDIEELIRLFKPLGRECAEAYILVRLYGRSIRSAALRMNLKTKDVQAHVDSADLYFVERLEGDPQGQSILARLITFFRGGKS